MRTDILVPGAAAVWSGAYAVTALAWTLGAPGYPFDPEDTSLAGGSGLIASASWAPAALGIVATLAFLLAAVLALAAARGQTLHGRTRAAVIGVALLLAVPLALVVPGAQLLALAGYAPIFVVGLPFGWPSDGQSYLDAWTWPVINQVICLVGGALWARVALAHLDRGALLDMARRWSRWAVAVAATVPLLYAAERMAWALGIPLGTSRSVVADLDHGDGQWAAMGLGLGALVGAVLTLGLVQRWGEVFPRWMIGLRGHRVPLSLAVVPGGCVAVLVTAAGVTVVREWITGGFGVLPAASVLPALLWPVWGVALATATAGYYRRRSEKPVSTA
jgi:hypothetical protein